MKIFLTGFMGAGKTTAGRKLAASLGYSFVDVDQLIENEEQLPVSEIFARKGEPYFRKKESSVLRNLSKTENTVVATGGGLPCFDDNMEWMNRNGITVYLSLSPEALFSRLKHARLQRPLISEKSDDELREYITEVLSGREPYYRKADFIAQGIDVNIQAIANDIRKSAKFQNE